MVTPYVRFACFECRKAFKKTGFASYVAQNKERGRIVEAARPWSTKSQKHVPPEAAELRQKLVDEYQRTVGVCPECAGQMIGIGYDVRPPKKRDTKAWKALHGAYRMGHQFSTCGCVGPGFIPSTPVEYRRYLKERLAQYELEFDRLRGAGKDEAAATYWRERVELVRSELASQ